MVENTQNICGGVPLTVAYMNALGKLARDLACASIWTEHGSSTRRWLLELT